MNLSKREKEILYVVQLQALSPLSETAAAAGCCRRTVAQAIKRWEAEGLIKRGCFLNLCLLGYTQYQVYLSLASARRIVRERILQKLQTAENVSWVGEVGGEFHIGFNICTRDVCEVSALLGDLNSDAEMALRGKAVAARAGLYYFGNKYLSARPNLCKVLSYQATTQRVTIDELDHRILVELVQAPGAGVRSWARTLDLPFSTLEYRLRRLQEKGVVQGFYFHVDAGALGLQSFLILFSTKGFAPQAREEFFRYCRQHPNVVLLIECIGSWDYEMQVDVEDARQVVEIVQGFYDRFAPQIYSAQTLPCFGYAKVREYPFRERRDCHLEILTKQRFV